MLASDHGTCYSANNQHALQQAALYGSAVGANGGRLSLGDDGRLPQLGRSMSMDIATALNARVSSPYQQQPSAMNMQGVPSYSLHQQHIQGHHVANDSPYQHHGGRYSGSGSMNGVNGGGVHGYCTGGYQGNSSSRLPPMLEFGGLHGSMMSGSVGGPPYGTVYDMKSLTSALASVQSGTGDVQRVLQSSTFRPRLPGLTKLVSQLSREGQWAKALEVYEALTLIALTPDTTITNAAISACDKGGQWEKALAVFHSMDAKRLPRDAITYSAVISALAKGRQWGLAIDVFNHMAASGIECDAVTCCSLITALDKGGQWQLAEEVFMQLYADHPQLSALLRCLKDDGAPLPPLPSAAGAAAGLDARALTGLAAAVQHMSLGGESAGMAALAEGPGAAGAGEGGVLSYPPSPMPAMPQRRIPSGDLLQMSTSSLLSMQSSDEADVSSHLLAPVAENAISNGGPDSLGTPPSGGLPPLPPGLGAGSGTSSAGNGATGQLPGSMADGGLLGPHTSAPQLLHRSISEPMTMERHQQQQLSPASAPYTPYASPPQSALPGPGGRLMRAGSLNSKKSAPHRVCCNALLAAYARAVPPQWGKAVKLLELMWRCGGELCPDIVSYNTVMKACGNAHQIGLAFELYQVMRSRGVEASVATFGTLISIASDAQAYARVKEAWGWLQASGLPVHITCVNSYMSALVKEDNWDIALQLFDSLKMQGSCVKPNTITFNILMSGCLAKEQPGKVKQLFDEMLNSGLAPTTVTFNNLINAYGKMGQWQEAVQVLGCLCRPNSSAKPVAATFNAVFATLRDAALTAPDQQLPALRSRSTSTYALLQGQAGIVPDATLYKNMIAAFFNCGDAATVLQLTTAMLQQGLAVDQGTVEIAVAALEAARAWELAPQLLFACCEGGARPGLAALQGLLVACARDGAWQAAYSIVTACGQLGQLEDVVAGLKDAKQCELLFLVLLQGKRASGAWRDALELFQLMRRLQPGFATANGALYGALLELLVGAGGAAGLLEAVTLCSEAHAEGAMTHYLPAGASQPHSPGSNSGTKGPGDTAQRSSTPRPPNVQQDTLRRLDVSSCSATEAVVLLLSWLGQILKLDVHGVKLASPILEVITGYISAHGSAAGSGLGQGVNREVPGGAAAGSTAAHSAVEAVLAGQLPQLLCVTPQDMAAQFEAAGRKGLGRVVCAGVPHCTSDEPLCSVLLLAEDVALVAASGSVSSTVQTPEKK